LLVEHYATPWTSLKLHLVTPLTAKSPALMPVGQNGHHGLPAQLRVAMDFGQDTVAMQCRHPPVEEPQQVIHQRGKFVKERTWAALPAEIVMGDFLPGIHGQTAAAHASVFVKDRGSLSSIILVRASQWASCH